MQESATDTTYNGWKNYPTWAVNLWLSNDEGLYHATQDAAEDFRNQAPQAEQVASGIWSVQDAARYHLADHLKDWVTYDLAPDLGPTFAADLLGYALDCVDWNEIASVWLEEVAAMRES